MDISYRFEKDVLVLASPAKSFLTSYLYEDKCISELNVLEDEAVLAVFRQQVAAGANCLVANTCDCLGSQLAKFNLADKQEEILLRALELANEAKPEHVLIELTWTGLPLDDMSRNSLIENKNQYVQIGRVLESLYNTSTHCFDGFYLSGLSDTTQIKCAMMGLRQVSDRPIICSVNCDDQGRFNKDESIYNAAQTISEFGGQVAGFCTKHDAKVAEMLTKRMRAASDLPIIVEFVVGREDDGKFSKPYDAPDTMRDAAICVCKAGATFLRASGRPNASYTSVLSVCAGLQSGR